MVAESKSPWRSLIQGQQNCLYSI